MFILAAKAVFVLFAIVGIAEVFRVVLFRMLRTKKPGKLYLVLSFQGHDEEAELALRGAIERVKYTMCGEISLVCVDCGMDAETRRICEILAKEYPQIRLCAPADLREIFCG